jgi:hypothetical protein
MEFLFQFQDYSKTNVERAIMEKNKKLVVSNIQSIGNAIMKKFNLDSFEQEYLTVTDFFYDDTETHYILDYFSARYLSKEKIYKFKIIGLESNNPIVADEHGRKCDSSMCDYYGCNWVDQGWSWFIIKDGVKIPTPQ